METYFIEASCPKHLAIALKVLYLHKDEVHYRVDSRLNDKDKMLYCLAIEGHETVLESIKHEYLVMKS